MSDAAEDGSAELSLMSEENIAWRIRHEMSRRGWSQERMAKEMTDAGHPLHQSAVSKIVNPKDGKRRAISVDDAIGFAKVFGLSLREMLLPIEAAINSEARALLTDLARLHAEQAKLREEASEKVIRLSRLTSDAGVPPRGFANVVDRDVLDASMEEMRAWAIKWFNRMHAAGELPDDIDPINPETEWPRCEHNTEDDGS